MKERVVSLLAIALVLGAGVFFYRRSNAPVVPAPEQSVKAGDAELSLVPLNNMQHAITLSTNFGDVTFATYDADAPKTVENFVTLAKKGFYDGLTFHRVVADFVIQGGDPECGRADADGALEDVVAGKCGSGGPGYTFADELNPNTASAKEGYKKGVVAMANAGPNTNGSQFFIMTADYGLPHNYTIFGKVIAGQDVVDRIGALKTNAVGRPAELAYIKKVTVR